MPIVDLVLSHPPQEWTRRAACRNLDPDFMFPEGNNNHYKEQRKVCAGCPVSTECAELGRDEAWGMWGGTTVKQRRALGGGRGRPNAQDGQVMLPRSREWVVKKREREAREMEEAA